MLTLPGAIVAVLVPFATLFTSPTWRKECCWFLTPGHRGGGAAGHGAPLSRPSRCPLLVRTLVFGSTTAPRSGPGHSWLRWISLMWLGQGAGRHWALPVLSRPLAVNLKRMQYWNFHRIAWTPPWPPSCGCLSSTGPAPSVDRSGPRGRYPGGLRVLRGNPESSSGFPVVSRQTPVVRPAPAKTSSHHSPRWPRRCCWQELPRQPACSVALMMRSSWRSPEPAVQSFQDLHNRAGIAGAFRLWQQLKRMQLELHRIVPGHLPAVLEAQDLLQG